MTQEPTLAYANNERSASGLSWAAIFAGAAAAGSLSLILLVLGSGLGFSAISPWANHGASAGAIGGAAIAWLAFTQIAASAMGGYLAGRLRVKWASVHTDEVYFRDTAHGFLAWSVATLVTAALLTSAIGSIVSGGATAVGAAGAAAVAGGAAAGGAAAAKPGAMNEVSAYTLDSLFRGTGDTPAGGDDTAIKAETGRIFANGLHNNGLAAEDKAYLVQVISKRTGLAPADAEKRVNDLYAKAQAAAEQAKQAADTARKAAAHSALWSFIGLLLAAFTASLAATFGGRRRDNVIHQEQRISL